MPGQVTIREQQIKKSYYINLTSLDEKRGFYYRLEFKTDSYSNVILPWGLPGMEERTMSGFELPEWPPTIIDDGFALEGSTHWKGIDAFILDSPESLRIILLTPSNDVCETFDVIYKDMEGRVKVLTEGVTQYTWRPTKARIWLPMSPLMGPPLPKWMGLTWPWYEAPKT